MQVSTKRIANAMEALDIENGRLNFVMFVTVKFQKFRIILVYVAQMTSYYTH